MANTIEEMFNSLDVAKTMDYLSEIVSFTGNGNRNTGKRKISSFTGYQCRT